MEIAALVISIFALILARTVMGNSNKVLLELNKKNIDDGRYKEKLDNLEKTIAEVTEMLPQVLIHVNATKAEVSELMDDYTITREVVHAHESFLTTGKQPRRGDPSEKETTVH
jgi:hypothetical protein